MIIRLVVIFILSLLTGWFVSCSMENPYVNDLFLEDLQETKKENPLLRRTFRTRSGKNECEDIERCKSICDQILDYAAEEKDCYNLSLRDVGRIETVLDIMKDPTESNLDKVRSHDFQLFVDYAASTWIEIIEGDYRKGENLGDISDREDNYGEVAAYEPEEAQVVLKWLYDNSWAQGRMEDFPIDTENIMYELLLKSFDNSSCSDITVSLEDDREITLELAGLSCKVAHQLKDDMFNIGVGGTLIQYSFKDSPDKEHDFYTSLHQIAEDVCEDARVSGENYSSSKNKKICLSVLYFEECDDCPLSFSDDPSSVARFLFQDTSHRLLSTASTRRSGSWLTYFINTNDDPKEGQWSDYW